MPVHDINQRERIRYDTEGIEQRDGTEYRCQHCGKWTHIDDWMCLGFTDEDIEDLCPESDPVYCGEDAICCPHCEVSQQTPGAIAVQTEMEFES
jgi:hypothetical protein